MSSGWRKWRGEAVMRLVRSVAMDMAAELGDEVVKHAKHELWKGHGVKTGTLRRDIRAEKPKARGLVITVRVGTGVRYGPYVEHGHQSFEGYHFLEKGARKAIEEDLPRLMKEYGFKWRR